MKIFDFITNSIKGQNHRNKKINLYKENILQMASVQTIYFFSFK